MRRLLPDVVRGLVWGDDERSAGLVDEMHLAVRPVLLGTGENLLHDIDLRALGYECWKSVAGERATHVFIRKRA